MAPKEVVVGLLPPGEATVATPSPRNNVTDTMTPNADTPQPKRLL
jgi:hypothetical protein